jgi:hypothetical protein
MTVVSSKEFATNQEKYFDLAVKEEVRIKRGKNIFHLISATVEKPKERVYYEPDEDFYRSISMEELLNGIHEDIHKMFANK